MALTKAMPPITAVIAVQTAYLKLHYPVEYMTALLSVNKNDTAKMALYVADTRRMGIRVEPPDVNASLWDFSIEDPAEGSPVIRFGLGAVKNVGLAPVEVILKAREKWTVCGPERFFTTGGFTPGWQASTGMPDQGRRTRWLRVSHRHAGFIGSHSLSEQLAFPRC